VDKGNDTLVRGSFGGDGELLAGLLENTDAGLAALGDEAVKTRVAAFAGDEHVVETALSGFEGFLNRVQAVENFH
jgi:hypothetical protein